MSEPQSMSEFQNPYSGYDVLEKWGSPSWNEQTRELIRHRLEEVPERTFLSAHEWRTLEAVAARLIPQPDRPEAPVPIVPWIDQMLAKNEGTGYRYENMPPMRKAWRLGLRGIDAESQHRYDRSFVELGADRQEEILAAIQKGEVKTEVWDEMPPEQFFSSALLKNVAGTYYSHPAAWSEIGYGGPASPRGYVRLGFDQRDAWEAKEEPLEGEEPLDQEESLETKREAP